MSENRVFFNFSFSLSINANVELANGDSDVGVADAWIEAPSLIGAGASIGAGAQVIGSVVGADAIFACLGPALEIFSRYSRVEKSSGEAVTLTFTGVAVSEGMLVPGPADSVMVLCREPWEGTAPPPEGTATWLAVAKVRAGTPAWVRLSFDGGLFREASTPAKALRGRPDGRSRSAGDDLA